MYVCIVKMRHDKLTRPHMRQMRFWIKLFTIVCLSGQSVTCAQPEKCDSLNA